VVLCPPPPTSASGTAGPGQAERAALGTGPLAERASNGAAPWRAAAGPAACPGGSAGRLDGPADAAGPVWFGVEAQHTRSAVKWLGCICWFCKCGLAMGLAMGPILWLRVIAHTAGELALPLRAILVSRRNRVFVNTGKSG